jgi:tRNA A37 threonylcarbamoyladenosine dehydratase
METHTDRFFGFRRLVGDEKHLQVRNALVCVVGLGGVGSWAVEALARCGVGRLTLVDLDDVCITNVNRQIHALDGTVGRSKAEVLAERVRLIHPECEVLPVQRFFTATSCDEILAPPFDVVLDAIDRLTNKSLLIATCVSRGIPIVTTGSAGDRADPTLLRVSDLAFTIHDPLLGHVRKRLRQNFNFPRGERKKFRVPCIYAPQQRNENKIRPPAQACSAEAGAEFEERRSCNSGLGTASFVTGSMGLFAASEVVKLITTNRLPPG